MKKTTRRAILGIIEGVAGIILFAVAQGEIWTNSRYTFTRPYTDYELNIILLKWCGILLIFSAVWIFIMMVYQNNYSDKHVKDITSTAARGGSRICPACGLPVSADISTCPRCKTILNDGKSRRIETQKASLYCPACGNSISSGVKYCPKCGSKIINNQTIQERSK